MIVSRDEFYAILRQFNPWWEGRDIPDLPSWHRSAFDELANWILNPPAPRAVMLTGARQVGKTTLFRQAIQWLLEHDVPPEQIFYATFDHPLLKLSGIEETLKVWREIQPRKPSMVYLFIDEIQLVPNWQVWLKHQVDFDKQQRVAVTGSAIPLTIAQPESGVGRWHTIKLPTLSFREYLQTKNVQAPALPRISSLANCFKWPASEFVRIGAATRDLTGHFHDYLLRGGFPQSALIESISLAQKLTREDIVEKMLKRDMTALYGVRRIIDLEKIFIYLCLHEGGILDVTKVGENLELTRPTVTRYLDLFEATHLVYKLSSYGHGKEVLRSRNKYYLADSALAGSVLLKGEKLLDDSARLGTAVETAVFKHLFTRYYAINPRFSYWRGRDDQEVDIIAEMSDELIPFEVKYRQPPIHISELKGLTVFAAKNLFKRGYIITRDSSDFGIMHAMPLPSGSQILRIPAPLFCYWITGDETGA